MAVTIRDDEAQFTRVEDGISARMPVYDAQGRRYILATVVTAEQVKAHVTDGYDPQQAIISLARGQIMEQAVQYLETE